MKKFLPFLLLLPLCLVNNTYADEVQDVTFTYTSQNSSSSPYICGNNSGVNCSDYTQIVIQSEDNGVYTSGTHAIAFYMSMNVASGSTTQQYNMHYEMSPRIVIDIPENGISSFQVWTVGTLTRNVTITLTNGGSGPSCPEPVIPDCEDPPIVRMFEGSFWNIASAIVALIVPILALFLLFRLVHGLMFGRGL